MSQTALLTVELKPDDQPLIKVGQMVIKGDVIIKRRHLEVDIINISKLLKIAPDKITRYLKVRIDQTVKAGDILAVKKSILAQQTVKTPVAGVIGRIDEKIGTVDIRRDQTGKDLVIDYTGRVKEVEPKRIVIEVKGKVIMGKGGQGEPISGQLKILPEENGVFGIKSDISGSVVVIKQAFPAVIAKADALGAQAIIAQVLEQPPFELPYLLVDDINRLHSFADKSVLVLGDQKQLIILEETQANKKGTKKST